MSITHPIAPHITRHGAVGKQRRPDGDPVAALKEMTRFEPVPLAPPPNLTVPLTLFDPVAASVAERAGKLIFHCVGDTGGINGTATQEAIAEAMEEQHTAAAAGDKPSFFYNLGDVVYFNGQTRLYKTEFYEPYQYYRALIFAIPGNHDGDTHVRRGDAADTEPSLHGFMQNFCAGAPQYVSPYRMSMTQPYVYWRLDAPFVTVIGLYSNVEGSLDARGRNDQQRFLEDAMKSAPSDVKLVIAVHHPPFSLDKAHGGCPDILNALDRGMEASGRTPDLILSGHVHNYQRFSRTVGGRTIPYVVAGAGGYASNANSLHKLQKALSSVRVPYTATHNPGHTTIHVQLDKYETQEPGFLRITAARGDGTGEYFTRPFDGAQATKLFDTFKF